MDLHNHLEMLRNNIRLIAGKTHSALTENDKMFLNTAVRFVADKNQNGGKYVAYFISSDILELAQQENPLLRVFEFEQAFSLELYLSNSDFNYLYHQNGYKNSTPVDVAALMDKDGRMSMFISPSDIMMDKFVEMFQ